MTPLASAFRSALLREVPEPERVLDGDGVLALVAPLAHWQPRLGSVDRLLSEDERARAQRQRLPHERVLREFAYALHRLLLAAVTGQAPAQVALHRDAAGCPRVAGDAVWTSLSHADGRVALAVSRAGRVGIDIEPQARAAAMGEIAAQVCHPEEWRALALLPAAERDRALLRLWVRKEALLKRAGVGLARAMTGLCALEDCVPAMTADEAPSRLWSLQSGTDWHGAVATDQDATLREVWLQPDALR